MEQTLLNRLVAARHLLETSGPSLTSSSPALLLAHKLLIAHDAAELVFSALAALPGAMPVGQDGQLIKDPSFMQLGRSVVGAAISTGKVPEHSQIKALQELSDARKFFKHNGMLVSPPENNHLFEDTVAILNEAVIGLLDVSLLTIDRTMSIVDVDIREHFESSRRLIESAQYKEALEEVAWGLARAFWLSDFTVGKSSSEDALLLAGYGVDPGRFLAMQQILPLTYLTAEEPEWDLRKFGHSGNWTKETSEFCLRVALDVVSKFQNAIQEPHASEFYDHFEDVIELIVESPEVFCTTAHYFSPNPANEKQIEGFQRGDRVTGRATGRYDRILPLTNDYDSGLEFAQWIAVESPKTTGISINQAISDREVLWFKAEHVHISYQIDARKQGCARRFSRVRMAE